jgi:hypothetical protein
MALSWIGQVESERIAQQTLAADGAIACFSIASSFSLVLIVRRSRRPAIRYMFQLANI